MDSRKLPIQWDLNDPLIPNHLRAPLYARLGTGDWLRAVRVIGDLIEGDALPWAEMYELQQRQKIRRAQAMADYRTSGGSAFVSGLVACAGYRVFLFNPLLGSIMMLCGCLVGLAMVKDAYMAGMFLRVLPIYDPGPDPNNRPQDRMLGQTTFGPNERSGGGFAQGATQQMGGGVNGSPRINYASC